MWAAIVCFALALAWLRAGRRITSLIDGVITIHKTALGPGPLRHDGGDFRIGAMAMTFAGTNNLRAGVNVTSDASGRVFLRSGGESFPLGTRTNAVDPRGRVDIDFVTDPGDEVRFTSSRSPLGWPTRFEIYFLGGPSPWWKRYVYYRLRWTKRSGGRLEMFWRYEQQYYSARGWTEPLMTWNSHTGLLRVKILPTRAY